MSKLKRAWRNSLSVLKAVEYIAFQLGAAVGNAYFLIYLFFEDFKNEHEPKKAYNTLRPSV